MHDVGDVLKRNVAESETIQGSSSQGQERQESQTTSYMHLLAHIQVPLHRPAFVLYVYIVAMQNSHCNVIVPRV